MHAGNFTGPLLFNCFTQIKSSVIINGIEVLVLNRIWSTFYIAIGAFPGLESEFSSWY